MKPSTAYDRIKHVTCTADNRVGWRGLHISGFLRGHLLHPFLDFPSDLIAHTIPYSTDGVHFVCMQSSALKKRSAVSGRKE